MRSLPLLEAFLLMLVLGAAAIPIVRLTTTQPVPQVRHSHAPGESHATGTRATCYVTIRTAHPPQSLTILHEGTPVLDLSEPPPATLDLEWNFRPEHLGPAGLELDVRAVWPDTLETETALEITLEPDARDARSATLWGTGDTQDFLTFTWP